jgi:Tol biopolymer transport system component
VANSGLFNETQGQFSPDGRWVAYASDESSRFEIYVVPFPPDDGRTGKTPVSSAGGRQPRWRADGKELYYLGLDGSVMAVDTQKGPVFQSETPHALFRSPTIANALTSITGTTRRGTARDF